MVVRISQAGKRAKCPDCGAANAVPIPKQLGSSREPPAMQGQQYALWDVDKAPFPEQLQAAQPQLFPVHCGVCDTLMYAQHKHIGKQMKCPDCGALTKIKAPPKEPEKKSVLVPSGLEYKIDPARRITASAVPAYIERAKHESKIAVEEQARRRQTERPSIPMLPTVFGVWSMLFRDPIPTWWLGTSVVGSVVAYFALEALGADAGAGKGLGAMYLLMCMVNAIILGVLWFAATAAIWCAIVTESSEGHRKLHASPSPWIFESFSEMYYLIFPIAACAILAFAASQFLPREQAVIAGGAALLFFFPVMLLSTLQESSPLAVFSPRIWASLSLRPAHWFVFYAQSAILWGAGVALGRAIFIKAPEWKLAIVPWGMAVSFLYFRLMGRLAWWLAESLPDKTGTESEPRNKRF